MPFIGRGNRRSHYDLHWRKPQPFLERDRCLGVRERVDHTGQVVVPLDEEQLGAVIDELGRLEVDAVAITFLFSYLRPDHEARAGELVRKRLPGVTVSLSHEVAPIWREFERSVTTIADAYLKPLLGSFVSSLEEGLAERGFRGRCSLLRSNGGTRIARDAASRPVELSLSGLAGGVMGGCAFAPDGADLITLDMGGTSCDIAVVSGGERRLAASYEVEFGLPLAIPAIEVSTIGAGGGSIAWVDGGGFLRVGPQSAGAVPGPAAYGRGGDRPTVTDANLVLGRIDPGFFLGGALPLDPTAAAASLAGLAAELGTSADDAALAVVRIANENMVNAIRTRTVEVGIDPRRYMLSAFGGAGPLHASAIARRLGIGQVLVPPHPGLCSAYGAATAPLRSDRVVTVNFRSGSVRATEVAAVVSSPADAAVAELRAEGFEGNPEVSASLGARYAGQNYEHAVALDGLVVTDEALAAAFARFEALHEAFYGYHLGGETIELVEVSVTATAAPVAVSAASCRDDASRSGGARSASTRACTTPSSSAAAPCPGATLAGPAVVEDEDATTLLEEGDTLTVLLDGTLTIDVGAGADWIR